MDDDSRELLERLVKLTEENTYYIRKIQRYIAFSRISRGIYWIVVTVLVFGSVYFSWPYIQKFIDTYNQIQGFMTNIPTLGN